MFKFNNSLYQNEMQEGGEPEAQPEQEQQPEVVPLDEYNALKQQAESMKNKMNELLGEKKREQAERLKAQEEAARKAGDFEQLYKSQEEQTNQYKQQLEELQNQIAKEKEQATALSIASKLADGDNAELLATFVQNRVKYTQEGIKILDESGQLTVATVDDLVNEFKNAPKFSALIRGSQGSGGGAAGNVGGGGAASKVMSRQEFEKLDPAKQMQFVKGGGSLSE